MRSHGQFNKGIDARRNDTGLRRAEPGRPGRLGVRPLAARILTAVLLAAFAALLALPAQAQTTAITLVSNTAESAGVGSGQFGAQSFETGSNTGGYTISEVNIHVRTASGKSTSVKIRENNASDEPGALVATLNNPATLTSNGLNTFTAPAGTTLAADTTYWISVNEGISSDRVSFNTTGANGETGEMGWSIGNGRLWRSSEGVGWTTSTDLSFLIAIKGTTGGYTASTDVTLSGPYIRSILVPYDLDLGEKALPEEEITVWAGPPFEEDMYVVAEGDRWSPSGVWGDPVKDMIWVVDPIHFGIHALKLSALKDGRIERYIAASTSEFDYRFNYNCHFKRTRASGEHGNPALTVMWGDGSTIWVANDESGQLDAYRRNGSLWGGPHS